VKILYKDRRKISEEMLKSTWPPGRSPWGHGPLLRGSRPFLPLRSRTAPANLGEEDVAFGIGNGNGMISHDEIEWNTV